MDVALGCMVVWSIVACLTYLSFSRYDTKLEEKLVSATVGIIWPIVLCFWAIALVTFPFWIIFYIFYKHMRGNNGTS